jgi:hypothetical protein
VTTPWGPRLRGAGQVIKVKHSKGSRQGRLEVLSARQALDMVQVLADVVQGAPA